jgi:hypothetical protein
MNPLIQLKQKPRISRCIRACLLWALAQMRAPQVAPAPDGCYPGFTTAEGCNALQFLGAGAGNTGVGWYSLYLVGGGNFNTGVGAGTLVLNPRIPIPQLELPHCC